MAKLALLAVSLGGACALDNGVGLTPAMGYNTWNDFRCSGISAANVMAVADAMVSLGLKVRASRVTPAEPIMSQGSRI